MKPLHLRRASVADAPALEHVGRATFLEAFAEEVQGADLLLHLERQYGRDLQARWLAQDGWAAWLAETEKGSPVGFLLLCPPDLPIATSAQDCEIKRIYLLSRYHGGGAAKAMMDTAIAHARAQGKSRLLLGVNIENHRALGFYRKMGFETVGTRHFTVGSEVHDDYIMARAL